MVFDHFFKAITYFAIIPATIGCSYERSFSKMNTVESKSCSTMGKDRLECRMDFYVHRTRYFLLYRRRRVIEHFKINTPTQRCMELQDKNMVCIFYFKIKKILITFLYIKPIN